jgi:hypothetical protein
VFLVGRKGPPRRGASVRAMRASIIEGRGEREKEIRGEDQCLRRGTRDSRESFSKEKREQYLSLLSKKVFQMS